MTAGYLLVAGTNADLPCYKQGGGGGQERGDGELLTQWWQKWVHVRAGVEEWRGEERGSNTPYRAVHVVPLYR